MRADAGTPASRLSRTTKAPRRFADEEKYTTTVQLPSALRRMLSRRAEREQAGDDDSAQPGAITGVEFVAREKEAAKAAGISSKRADAPACVHGERPKKVPLPAGWKPSSKKEAEAYLENLTHAELNELMKLHHYAFFSKGGYHNMGKNGAVKFIRAYGLVVGPWHKAGFKGMCNSEALVKRQHALHLKAIAEKKTRDALKGGWTIWACRRRRSRARGRTRSSWPTTWS